MAVAKCVEEKTASPQVAHCVRRQKADILLTRVFLHAVHQRRPLAHPRLASIFGARCYLSSCVFEVVFIWVSMGPMASTMLSCQLIFGLALQVEEHKKKLHGRARKMNFCRVSGKFVPGFLSWENTVWPLWWRQC